MRCLSSIAGKIYCAGGFIVIKVQMRDQAQEKAWTAHTIIKAAGAASRFAFFYFCQADYDMGVPCDEKGRLGGRCTSIRTK